MLSDQDEIARGLRLAAVAVLSAIVTATLVIGAGSAWLSPADPGASTIPLQAAELARTSG